MIRFAALNYNLDIIKVGSRLDKLYNVLDIDGYLSKKTSIVCEHRWRPSFKLGDVEKIRLNLWKITSSNPVDNFIVNRSLTFTKI